MLFISDKPFAPHDSGPLNGKIAGFTPRFSSISDIKIEGFIPRFGRLLNRKSAGFTLAELIIATLIFGLMVASLSTLYSTANKHMFQNYRMDKIKSDASVAMKSITSRLSEANRIDSPALNATGSILAFAVNVDQLTACYPVNNSEAVTWHYFCRSGITQECPLGGCLYYHTGTIAGGGGCPGAAWTPTYPVPTCGCAGCGTVTLLTSFVDVSANPLFSRQVAGSSALVNVNLRVRWDPATNGTAARDFRNTGKLIDTTLTTTVRVNRAGLSGTGF